MSNKAINWAYSQKLDNPLKKFVLVTLADAADAAGYLYKYYSTVADMCDMSRRTAIRHIKQLEDDGYLIKETRNFNGFFSSNIYRLNMDTPVPDDHPLKCYCKISLNEGGDNLTPPSDSVSLGGVTVSLGGDTVSLIKEPLLNPPLTERERDALSRDGFFREMDKGFKADAFKEFPHLTESEIAKQAALCWDHWAANGKWPGGEPEAILRNWIRAGIAKGKVRKATPETAHQGKSVLKEPETPEDQWQLTVKGKLPEAEYRAWIRPLYLDGVDIVCPSRFFADHVRQNYAGLLSEVLMFNTITHNQQKETANA